MRQLWSDDPHAIEQELRRLIAEKTPATLYQKGRSPHRLIPLEITRQGEQTLLLLHKEAAFVAGKEPCLILYLPEPGGLTRGFPTAPARETDTQLAAHLPASIFVIQRRKHPRYTTNPRSSATFARLGSQYINHGSIENICLEGVKLVGHFSTHIQKGDTLSPLTLVLRLAFGDYEEKVTVAEAYVRRVTLLENEKMELGVQFIVDGADLASLESYLTIRSLEEMPLLKDDKGEND